MSCEGMYMTNIFYIFFPLIKLKITFKIKNFIRTPVSIGVQNFFIAFFLYLFRFIYVLFFREVRFRKMIFGVNNA